MPFKNREAYNAWKRAWIKKQKLIKPEEFRSKTCKYNKKYKDSNKEQIKKYNHDWKQANPDKVKAIKKRFIAKRLPTLKRYVRFVRYVMGCKECRERDPDCLQFHHINPESKFSCVTSFHNFAFNKLKIQQEIKKCIILCSNCHDKHHAKKRRESTCLLSPSK